MVPLVRTSRWMIPVVAGLFTDLILGCHGGDMLYGPRASARGDAGDATSGDARSDLAGDRGDVEPQCVAGTTQYANGTVHPDRVCEVCRTAGSEAEWQVRSDGTSCDTGKVCYAGACVAGCVISAVYDAPGAPNPGNPCQRCDPSQSTSRWTRVNTPCVEAVTSGFNHVCAVFNGAARCWGSNTEGQLGDGSSANFSPVPVVVENLTSKVQAILAGDVHTCAIAEGEAWCWGRNNRGQLGDNSTKNRPMPVQVQGLESGVQGIAAGRDHTCAVVNGRAQCWGANTNGVLLGNRASLGARIPLQVEGLTAGVESIATANDHTCAVVNGGAKCWGWGDYGQLGDGTDRPSSLPVQVEGLSSGVDAITTKVAHTCAVVRGAAWCWGDNSSGQLGNDSNVDSSVPVPVHGLASGVQAISVGYLHTCALVEGGVRCWGENSAGQLGNDSDVNSPVPVPVQGLASDVQFVAAGLTHTCALSNGSVRCWGGNRYGQLGTTSVSGSKVPMPPVQFQ